MSAPGALAPCAPVGLTRPRFLCSGRRPGPQRLLFGDTRRMQIDLLRPTGRPTMAPAAAASPLGAAADSNGAGSSAPAAAAADGAHHTHHHHRSHHHDASTTEAAEQQQEAQQQQGFSPTLSYSEETAMLTLKDEVEELRELLQRQGRIIEQQQGTIRLLEDHLTAASSNSRRLPATAGPARSLSSFDALAAVSSLGTLGEPLGELSGAEQPQDPRLKLTVGPGVLRSIEPEIGDRRQLGFYDARYHSTNGGAIPRDFRVLPRRIVLVRHAQSEGNVDNFQYTYVPDPKVPLTARGWEQALDAGEKLRGIMDSDGHPYRLFFYTSPYLRSKQTYEGLIQAFEPEQLIGVQEEVQLREQDFGNFQDAEGKKREKAERLRFGRFFYRFPNGESGADVYDRMTIFEDHLVRDINAGRYGHDSTLVLVTHGLAARIFLMRWFHWTVDQFMNVFNPPNAEPIVMERITSDTESRQGGPACWIHTKALYRLTDASMDKLVGCTEDMCSTSWLPRGIGSPREYSSH